MVPPTLRKQLEGGRCLLVPGVYDCVSAKLAETNGFGAVAISGYCVEATLLGQPDLGFTTAACGDCCRTRYSPLLRDMARNLHP